MVRTPVRATPAGSAHQHLIERPVRPIPGPRRLLRDVGAVYAANGLIGLIFAATGPVAVILAVGTHGGLSPEQLASWIFGAFFLNGILTVAACWLCRQPLGNRAGQLPDPRLRPGLADAGGGIFGVRQ